MSPKLQIQEFLIINNCPEIQLICLNVTTEVTNESIDELIEEIALKRPHISFQFDLGSVERCYETIITKLYDRLPKNQRKSHVF